MVSCGLRARKCNEKVYPKQTSFILHGAVAGLGFRPVLILMIFILHIIGTNN
jgi:hypothetical protein